MSSIFEALQKAESDRHGIDRSKLSTATELLQIAERRAAAELKGLLPVEQPRTHETVEDGKSFRAKPGPRLATTAAAPVIADQSSSDAIADRLARCQSLEVALPEEQLVCLTDDESLAAENFRFLGVRLRQLRRERPLHKIMITSTIPHEGKSMVAANLACTLARRKRQRTLLLEGDVRQPSLSRVFGCNKVPGLCEWLQGEQSEAANIYHLERANLWFVPAGSFASDPLELLQSVRLPALMNQLTELFDWIIIDAPPVLPLADTSVLSRLADGIILVARQGTTQKRHLQKGIEALDRKKLIGALVNSAESAASSERSYYYRPSTSSIPENQTEK
jgi:capsular exopolysaccharide synthesis family protein